MSQSKSDIKPQQAALIIVFFVIVFGMVFWFMAQQAKHTGASLLHYKNGWLNILVGQEILRYSDDGAFGRIRLQDLGIEKSMGGFDFYPNGDLLIRSAAPELGLMDRIRVLFRFSGDFTSRHPEARLMRCALKEPLRPAACRVVVEGLSFERTFRPEILEDDSLIIADTANHRLLRFSADGRQVETLNTGFKFPNQVSLINDTLYVANTNRHAISWRKVTGETRLGAAVDWQHWSLEQGESGKAKHTFPTEFVKLDKAMAVLSQGPNLKLGNIYLLDQGGGLVSAFERPKKSDLISMALINGEILASSFYHYSVHRFDFEGNYLGDLNLPELSHALNFEADRAAKYDQYILVVVLVGGGVFVFLLAIGLWLERGRQRRSKESLRERVDQFEFDTIDRPELDDPRIIWIRRKAKNRNLEWAQKIIPYVLGGLLLYSLVSLFLSLPSPARWYLVAGSVLLLLLYIPLYRWNKSLLESRLGVLEQWLILVDTKARSDSVEIGSVKYANDLLIVGEVYIQLGQGKAFIFDQAHYDQEIKPRLAVAQKLGPLEALKYLWQKRDPVLMLSTVGLLLFVLLQLLL